VDDVVQSDNINMLEFFHERDLANSGRGCAFFRVEVNFFERNNLIGGARASLENKKTQHYFQEWRNSGIYLKGLTLKTVAYVPSPSFSS
jgi:hypothetical protein